MNDLISRQAAIDELNVSAELLKRVLDDADVVGAERAKYEWELELIESYISDMKELPPAQPEQKVGTWIIDGHHLRCSACGVYMCSEDREGDRIALHFCPNCGAKMKEE